MIVVRVELHSAITGKRTELARMQIANVGGDMVRRNYACRTLRGRDTDALDKGITQRVHRGETDREAEVDGWPSQAVHVWNLVGECLAQMGYGKAARKK